MLSYWITLKTQTRKLHLAAAVHSELTDTEIKSLFDTSAEPLE